MGNTTVSSTNTRSFCSESYFDGGNSILGNTTVSSTNTSTTHMINPYETDPERLCMQRQKLKTLHHAARCCQDGRRLSSDCTVRHCLAAKTLYKHVTNCTQACQVPGCKNGRLIWKHYLDCKVSDCRICSAVPTTNKESDIPKKYVIQGKSSSASTTRSITSGSNTSTTSATTLVFQDIIKTMTTSVRSQSRSSYGLTIPVLIDNYEIEDESIMTSSPSSVQDNTMFLKPRLSKELLQVQQQQQQQQAPQQQPGHVKRPSLLKGLFTHCSQTRRVLQERNESTANTSNSTTMARDALASLKRQQPGGRPLMAPPMTRKRGHMIPRHEPPSPRQESTILSPPRRLAARYSRPPLSPTRSMLGLV